MKGGDEEWRLRQGAHHTEGGRGVVQRRWEGWKTDMQDGHIWYERKSVDNRNKGFCGDSGEIF